MSDVIVDVDTYVSEMALARADVIGPVTSFLDGDTGDKVAMPTTGLNVLVVMNATGSTGSIGETVGKPSSKYCWGALYLSPVDGVSRIILQRADDGDQ